MSAAVKREASIQSEAATHISELTGAKIRIFLAEVAEGVSNYRSLHSLTQQVEHQYHGRFLIELIQNAHDAFAESASEESPNRIEIVYDASDSEHGSLLVANDGLSFSQSNFERLSQLGQSDKDPEKSIGNKGIGFRSVLEVSERPEVYSRTDAVGSAFDGYCFAFRPEVVHSLVEPMVQLAHGGPIPNSPLATSPLVDWSDDTLAKFRRRVRNKGSAWLHGETKYLSPYLLPVPIARIESAAVKDFEARGFATVVRLPLKFSPLQATVLERMAQLTSSTVLFLDKLGQLTVRTADNHAKSFERTTSPLDGDDSGVKVTVAETDTSALEYAVWTRLLHVPDAPEEFRAAVLALPGRWPEIVDVSVSIAVRLGDKPDVGRFSIYLPTLVPTGSGVHVNGPFFGDMSRTAIDFEDAYNHQLLQTAGDLSVDVIRNRLAGKGPAEAKAIVDLLSPYGNNQTASERWTSLINAAAQKVALSIDEEPLILSSDGWCALNQVSLVPSSLKAALLTETLFRKHATFSIFDACLDSRKEQLIALTNVRKYDTGAYPLASDIAATVAAVASELHANGGDWNAFWRDIMFFLPNEQAELAVHKVLLGTDGMLHRGGAHGAVFFVQRQGTQDAGDVDGEGGTTEIPASLQTHVAFLSDRIQLYDANRPTVQTPVRAYLGNGLVAQFRIETIFNDVLKKLTPTLPVPIKGAHFEKCRDIMQWALRLIGNLVARGKGAAGTSLLLRTIPVPCRSGWYPMSDASFSSGWPDTAGAVLHSYLSALKSRSGADARKRMLLPPGNPAWGDVRPSAKNMLGAGGVFDGLKLYRVNSDAWAIPFSASLYSFSLPSDGPADLTKEQWKEFKNHVEREATPPFSTPQPYAVGAFHVFPGFSEAIDSDEGTRLALSELILRSLANWGQGLESLDITKQGGQWNRLQVTSPLRFFLQASPWLSTWDAQGWSWSRPAERWHVPADALSGRARHFAHLRALPSQLAKMLDTQPALAGALQSLGMAHFDLHSDTASPRLLQALIASIGSDEVSDANVLLGQIRDAWHRFRPPSSQQPLDKLAIRRNNKQLEAISPTIEAPIYLPDYGAFVSELEQFGLPVLAIGVDDAKALREWFAAAYGSRVQLTSALELVPQANGTLWTGMASILMADSELSWLIPPLLALIAFHGQMRGIYSRSFQERVDLLREVRIDWVASAGMAVLQGDTTLVTAEVPAIWNAQRKCIIATQTCRTKPADLSTALSQMLDRDDLELPLRYILDSLDSVENEPEELSSFLLPLRISSEQVLQVLEHLRGDVGHMGRLIHILAGVLAPRLKVPNILAARTEEELESALAAANIPNLDVHTTMEMARESQDMFDFGRSMSRSLGEIASLALWNKALEKLGHSPLTNRNWATQFQAGLEEASGLMKRVLAHLIRQGSAATFAELWSAYESLPEKVNLGLTYWEVNFHASIGPVADLAFSLGADSTFVDAIRLSVSAPDLRRQLSMLDVPLDIDPDECSRENHRLVDAVARRIERLRLAWWLKLDASKRYGEWNDERDKYRDFISAYLSSDGFTRTWKEADVFGFVRDSEIHHSLIEFRLAIAAAVDVDSLQAILQISADEVDSAEGRLSRLREESTRRRHIVKVCDRDFDSSDDNLDQLWTFLKMTMPDEAISAFPPLDVGKVIALTPVKSTRPSGGEKVARPPSRKQQRQPKSVDELVGFAGEIFVYRMLQATYGSDVVSSSTWVSENGRRVYPHNLADDSRGCDFAFTAKGKLIRVEVKSTAGDDESFTLGSSEIRLAMELASKGKRRRESFVLVHVQNALADTPAAVVLPNPYDPKFAGMFRIEEADARVRYWATD